jgi:hypothetical protein
MVDASEEVVLFVHPEQYGVHVHSLDPGFELLESSARFGTTTSHNQMLTVESTHTGHPVSSLFILL